MRARKNVWGGVFFAVVIFTVLLVADLTLNQALNASYIYANWGLNKIPAEALFIGVLTLPVIALISGIMFLIYFVKTRKQKREVAEVA